VEEQIATFLQTSRLQVVHILPGWMFGPGDWAPTSSGQIVLDFLNRKLPVGIPGWGGPVDARDVAAAMIVAAERGRSGERYIIGGDSPVPFRTIFGLLEELSGVPGPRVYPPIPIAYAYAAVSEFYGRVTGKPVTATREGVRTLAEARPTSSAKAVGELGTSFRPLHDTLQDEIAWFRRERPELLAGAGAQTARA
jgi:dihydroflavonol-4-reductase